LVKKREHQRFEFFLIDFWPNEDPRGESLTPLFSNQLFGNFRMNKT